jgi:hypothetical protein
MAFDIGRLDEERTRWIRVGLDDMEVQIRHSGPHDQERWRARLVKANILKQTTDGISIKQGRAADFFLAYVKQHVIDWKNVKIGDIENPEYDADRMAKVIGQSDTVFRAVRTAVEDETDFLSESDNGSGD